MPEKILVYEQKYPYTIFHNKSTDFITGDNPPYHRHNAYEIYFFLSGNVKLYIEDTCYQLSRGDMAVVNPSELHRSICLDSDVYERIGVNIKQAVFDDLNTNHTNLLSCFYSHTHGKNNIIHLNENQISEYMEIADEMIRATRSNEYGDDLLSYSLLIKLLVFVNRLYSDASQREHNHEHKNLMPNIIVNAMNYINDHLTEQITLDDLSLVLNYNKNYISNSFKQYTGLTLKNYITGKRVDLACKLLRSGKNVSEACTQSGFNDYANFIRNFKKITGVSPGRYKTRAST